LTLRPAPLALLGLIVAAACGSKIYVASPTPSPTLVPRISASPTAAPGPSASPLPSPSPPEIAISPGEGSGELFFALFGGVPPPFQVRVGTTLSGSASGTALTVADVDGADYRAQLHVELDGAAAQDSQIIVFDGTGYVADAGSDAWRAFPDYETVPPLNPFLELDPSQWLELGGDATHAGLDRLHSTTWRMPADSSLVDRVSDVSFYLWIDEQGLPVSAELTFSLGAIDGTPSAGYHATYSFSGIGDPVVIAPPIAPPIAPIPTST
jgi:hypothetical protein